MSFILISEEEVFLNVKKYNLNRPKIFNELSLEQFKNIYNGYGPDRWNNTEREIMTWIFRNFQEVAAVHDVQYHYSDGSYQSWLITQRDWEENSRIMLNIKYPVWKFWLLPFRAIAWNKLHLAKILLAAESFKIFQDAYKTRMENLKNDNSKKDC